MPKAFVMMSVLCVAICANATRMTPQDQATAPSAVSTQQPAEPAQLSTLKICLRLDDQTPFLGAACIRALPESGEELLGLLDETKGEMSFYAVPSGKYTVQVSAPAFLTTILHTDIAPGGERTLFVVMKRPGPLKEGERPGDAAAAPEPNPGTPGDAKAAWPSAEPQPSTAPMTPKKENWKPVDWKDEGAVVDSSVVCPTEQVLRSAGERVREFVSSMEKFTATETVEHYPIDKTGERKQPQTRKFAYVVTISQDALGTFALEEFRDGGTDRSLFPASIATMGLPAVVLVFHPDYAGDFEYHCDGLIHVQDHDYWQVRFAQRKDRPVRIESYVVNGAAWPVFLQGRVWIDPGKGQVVRLESQLLKPTPQIELWQQHQIINYTGVKFASTGEEVWLPQSAEVYVERHGKRYYRRHSFQDFRLFNVDTAQNVKAPKGSYSFTNLTDSDMTGELTVNPVAELTGGPIILRFEVPAHRTVIKTVGPGRDVNLPPASIASAKFVHSGETGSVKVDVDLLKETTLDIVPERALANP